MEKKVKLIVRRVFVENEFGRAPACVLVNFLPREVFVDLLKKGVIYRERDYNARRGYRWCVDIEKAREYGVEVEKEGEREWDESSIYF